MRFLLLLTLFYASCTGSDQVVNVATNTDYYKWNAEKGRSIEGIDVVAYFSLEENEQAVKGKKEFSYSWEGFTWQFSTQKNLDAFKEDPEKYIPQYDGFCAYAVSRNYTASIDPNAWTIHDGKLYVNYSKSVRDSWGGRNENKRQKSIDKGNRNWPGLKKKL